MLKTPRLDTSKEYLCRMNIDGTDMLQNCLQNVRNRQKKRAVPNLPATASWIMKTV